jgi:hypothetical protein
MALIVGGDGSLYQLMASPGEVVADRVTSVEALSAPTPRIVRDVGFSPSFAHDRRIYAAVISISAPTGEDVGLLISTNAGVSWTPPTEGPALDGTRFGFIERLIIPPSSDSTLFALASPHGEPIAERCIEGIPLTGRVQTLFRSADAGQSWSPVTTLGPACRHSVQMAFAPDFATSGVAHLTDLWTGESLAATTCEVYRTRDWGEQWRRRTIASAPGSTLTTACGYPSLPEEVPPPPDVGFPASALAVAISPGFDIDHTIFFAARGQLWMYAPSAQ